jgi:DNA-binding NarL/FixJ family response regulator
VATLPRVLVVDDDENVRSVVCEVLREAGLPVVGEAADGLEGVEQAAALAPDVVLLDVRMPRLGGIEAARRIRAANARVRLVILSAYDDATLKAEAEAVGASAFLVKGCGLSQLLEAVV